MLAIQVAPPEPSAGKFYAPDYNQCVLSVRLDAQRAAGALTAATVGEGVDLEVKLVEERAVVCDLCSSLSKQRPACVDQCPHEAALRVNARFEFPEA